MGLENSYFPSKIIHWLTRTSVHMANMWSKGCLFLYLNLYSLTGEEDAPEEGASEQADNEPDSEDATPKGGVINIYFFSCSYSGIVHCLYFSSNLNEYYFSNWKSIMLLFNDINWNSNYIPNDKFPVLNLKFWRIHIFSYLFCLLIIQFLFSMTYFIYLIIFCCISILINMIDDFFL